MRLPVTLSILVAAVVASDASAADGDLRRARLVAEAAASAAPGDVVFKTGEAFWGRLAARFSPNDEGWGHVGIAALDDAGALVVIHAGGDPLTPHGRVQQSSFEFFIGGSEAFALYRPDLSAERVESAVEYATAAAARAAPFDVGFSLATEEDYYCTELIWRAFSAALGEDAIPKKSIKAGREFLSLADVQESPFLAERWSSRRASAIIAHTE